MKINRIIAAVTAAAAILSLSACNGGNNSSSSVQNGQTSSVASQESTAEAGTAQSGTEQTAESVLNSGTAEDFVIAQPINGAEGMEVTFGEFLREYRFYLARNGYEDDTDSSIANELAEARQEIIDGIIEDRIVRAKFTEFGMNLSDEDMESIKSDVDSGVAQIKSGIKQTIAYADNTLTEEQLSAQADERFEQLLSDCGLTMDTLIGWQEVSVMKTKLAAEIGKDTVYSYEDAQKEMQTLIDVLKSQYEKNPEQYYGQSYANIWVPEGSRAVQAILVGFDSDVYSQIQQLRSEGNDDGADKYREEKLADIKDRYDDIMGKISSGSDFAQLMADNNEDEGNGTFLITPGTEIYGRDFAECAMGIENPGDVAACVTDFGYYIVRYLEDAAVSDDTLKECTEELQAYLLENEKSKLYSAEFDKWKTEYAYETNAEVLGLN